MSIDQTHIPDSFWDDLVISILSVNQYSLEKTYAFLQAFRTRGLTDPVRLADWTAKEIEDRLRAPGCDRATFMTALFAERLSALGSLIRSKGIRECEKVLSGSDSRAIEALLLPVKGVGPVVLKNFFSLRGISPVKAS